VVNIFLESNQVFNEIVHSNSLLASTGTIHLTLVVDNTTYLCNLDCEEMSPHEKQCMSYMHGLFDCLLNSVIYALIFAIVLFFHVFVYFV